MASGRMEGGIGCALVVGLSREGEIMVSLLPGFSSG